MEITREKQSEPYSSSKEKKTSVAKAHGKYAPVIVTTSWFVYSFSLTIPFRIKFIKFTVTLMKIASREVSLQYINGCDLDNRVGHMCICVVSSH